MNPLDMMIAPLDWLAGLWAWLQQAPDAVGQYARLVGANPHNYIHLVLLGAACALLAAYICRIDKLNWRTHRPASVLLYASNAGAVAMVALHAWQSRADALDVAVLLCAATLLRASWPRWANGRPPVDMVRPDRAGATAGAASSPERGDARGFEHTQTLL